MNKEVRQLIVQVKGEASALLADYTNDLNKSDVVALGYLYGLIDDILLGNLEREDYTEEELILSRMYEVYAMICYSETTCLKNIRKMLNTITEVL